MANRPRSLWGAELQLRQTKSAVSAHTLALRIHPRLPRMRAQTLHNQMRTPPKSPPSSAPAQTTAVALSTNAAAQNLTAVPTARYRCLFPALSTGQKVTFASRKTSALKARTFRSDISALNEPISLVLRIHPRLLRMRAKPLIPPTATKSFTIRTSEKFATTPLFPLQPRNFVPASFVLRGNLLEVL